MQSSLLLAAVVTLGLCCTVCSAKLKDDYSQDAMVEPNESFRHHGHLIRGYRSGDRVILEPFVAFNLRGRPSIRKHIFGNGYYFTLPLRISQATGVRARRVTHIKVHRFQARLRKSYNSWCSKTCSSVAIGSMWTTRGGPQIIFRCQSRKVCKQVFNSLYFSNADSDFVRSAFQLKFYGKAGTRSVMLLKNGLPVAAPKTMPYKKEFWFEGNKLLLFSIKAGIGMSAHQAYNTHLVYRKPKDGSFPDVYRSNLLNNLARTAKSSSRWQMVAEMRKDGEMVAKVVFDIKKNSASLNSQNWFSADRVVSSYPYWLARHGYNYFSINGHHAIKRHFFIQNSYGGCGNDVGFWVVSDKRDGCPWANRPYSGKVPTLLYNPLQGVAYATTGAHKADRFLIYLRYNLPEFTPRAQPKNPYTRKFYFERSKLLLYTIKAGIGQSAYWTFMNRGNFLVPADNSLPDLYRSDLIESLSAASRAERKSKIVVEMRKNDRKVAQVKFSLSGAASKTNWFNPANIVSSYPYSLPKTRSSYNFFSIAGHVVGHHRRRYFINFGYGGCHRDNGFMAVIDNIGRSGLTCPWEYQKSHKGKAPTLTYTVRKGETFQSHLRRADRLLIYLE